MSPRPGFTTDEEADEMAAGWQCSGQRDRPSGLRKSYGRMQAARSVDLTVARGETVALLGPNGAGNSTTLDMIMGLIRPDSGTVTLFGMPPKETEFGQDP
jgi:ABC-2 type transport system ATP-binding protein